MQMQTENLEQLSYSTGTFEFGKNILTKKLACKTRLLRNSYGLSRPINLSSPDKKPMALFIFLLTDSSVFRKFI